MAKNGVQDSVHGVQGSVQRTTKRTNRHDLPSPCRIPSVRPPTSNRRPQGGHPCIERTRDAQGRSNVLRPLQRRFKARKKPEGCTSTPAGLNRLKTQNTAFRGNENGKGTPSGVPQPIHKRKLILVKEEFDASSFGGAEGNRTPVRKQLDRTFSGRSLLFTFPRCGGNRHSSHLGSFMMHDAGKAYCVHGRRFVTPKPGSRPFRGGRVA